MKNMRFFSKRFLVMAFVAVSLLAFTSCSKDDDDNNNNDNRTFTLSGNANGTNMVPAVTGNGTATITGTYNASNNTMTYTTNWNGLSGVATSGGFYTAAAGQNGTIIGSPWTFNTTTDNANSLSGQMTLTDDQETQLLNGNWYYTIGTAMNTNGEVRGQITATPQ